MNNKPFVNPFEIPASLIDTLRANGHRTPAARSLPALTQNGAAVALTQEQLFSGPELERIVVALNEQPWRPVGLDGIADNYTDGDPVGSWRASCFTEELADLLWQRLDLAGHENRVMSDRTPTDWDGHRRWRAVGVNPLMRFIRYEQQGLLVPHYDAPFDYGDGRRRTLVTVVVYLEHTPGAVGGSTRFIADPQLELGLAARDYSDWTRAAAPEEIVAEVAPQPGSALIFDHRMLHDSEPLTGSGRKTIVRTDVVYERVG